MSVCVSLCLSVCVCLSVCMSVCLRVCLMSFCLSVCVFVYLFVCPSQLQQRNPQVFNCTQGIFDLALYDIRVLVRLAVLLQPENVK